MWSSPNSCNAFSPFSSSIKPLTTITLRLSLSASDFIIPFKKFLNPSISEFQKGFEIKLEL